MCNILCDYNYMFFYERNALISLHPYEMTAVKCRISILAAWKLLSFYIKFYKMKKNKYGRNELKFKLKEALSTIESFQWLLDSYVLVGTRHHAKNIYHYPTHIDFNRIFMWKITGIKCRGRGSRRSKTFHQRIWLNCYPRSTTLRKGCGHYRCSPYERCCIGCVFQESQHKLNAVMWVKTKDIIGHEKTLYSIAIIPPF